VTETCRAGSRLRPQPGPLCPHLVAQDYGADIANQVTDLTIERVAADSGLGSATNLRIQFSQVLGTSPTSYRRTFQAQAG
jgi:AraC-like DNA-binding protein